MFACDIGDGACLRLWEPGDASELHRLIEANQEILAPWMPWAGQGLDETREYIASTRRGWAKGGCVETGIVVDGAIVGAAGLVVIDEGNRAANIGYWLAADAQGRGLVTRAVTALLDHGFDALELHRVTLLAAVANERSRAVARRLAFTEEGIARDAERIGDGWLDLVVHSMLADEWRARRTTGSG